MQSERTSLFLRSVAVLAFCMAMSVAAYGASVTVYVGYADDLRPAPFFPDPWSGSANVDLFAGNASNLDAGAVRIQNTGATDVTIDSLTVTFGAGFGGVPVSLWSGSLPFVLHPGKDAIFTQTSPYNFDTSEIFLLVPTNAADNCSVGPKSSTALCVDNAPVITFGLNGSPTVFKDTKHILDTGGFDFVYSDPCPVPGDSPGACNESLAWRPVGTTGIDNPGGDVPEPATYSLLGAGLGVLACVGRLRRKK